MTGTRKGNVVFLEDMIDKAAETNEPSQVARFLLDLTGEFSTYYHANKVTDPDHPERFREMLGMVLAVREVLAAGLQLLGIVPLERM